MKIKLTTLALLITLLLASCQITTVETLKGTAPTPTEAQMLKVINRVRTIDQTCNGTLYKKSNPVVWNEKLQGAAMTHVKDVLQMHSDETINVRTEAPPHLGSDYKRVDRRTADQGYKFNLVAENLASTSNTDPNIALIVLSWLGSAAGHCEAIVTPEFKDVGLYFEDGVWAVVFAEPLE